VWYDSSGEVVRGVRADERAVEAWEPQWVARERGRPAGFLPSGHGSIRWDYYDGGGLYVGREVIVPRYAGYRNYYHPHYHYHGRRGGFRGFYSHHGGHSHWGVSYRRPGFSLEWRR
ncbi:MAG: hypothetical protein ACQKBY_01070, partial [Verrucomicrobiales bacterium]